MLDVKGQSKKRDRNNQKIKLPNIKGQGFPLTLLLSYGLLKRKRIQQVLNRFRQNYHQAYKCHKVCLLLIHWMVLHPKF